jgi:O-antigen ligase
MILFLIAMGLIFEIDVVGHLTGTEIIFCLYLPLCGSKLRTSTQTEKWFYIMAAGWFLGAIATDLYRDTPFDDLARGWSKIFFFIVNFTAIRVLTGKNINRLTNFIFFLFIASAVRLALGELPEGLQNMGLETDVTGLGWKFGYGQLFSVSVLLIASKFSGAFFSYPVGIMLPFLAAAVNLALNARNLAGITALSAVIVGLTAGRRRQMSPGVICVIGLGLLLAGYGVLSLYEYVADQGYLGTDARVKYEEQSEGDLGLLAGGRPEFLASTQAVIDSPILGHGSWAHDMSYTALMVAKLKAAGVKILGNPYETGLIPTHSTLMGAWVESGILGAAFWFWAMGVTLRGLYATLRRPSPQTGFIAFVGMSLLWNIMFSPLGLEYRVITAAWLYLMMLVGEKPNPQPNPGHGPA